MSEEEFQLYKIEDFTFKKYSDICPEQWYIYYKDQKIGYIRTRWGEYRVDYYPRGFDVYETKDDIVTIIEGITLGFGSFNDDAERIKIFEYSFFLISKKMGIETRSINIKEFEEWSNGATGDTVWSQRFIADLDRYKQGIAPSSTLVEWIKLAFTEGYFTAIKK